jgi:hypothetical protein
MVGVVGRQSTGLQQRSDEGQEPEWQMYRTTASGLTHVCKERPTFPVTREVKNIIYFCLY